MKKNIYIVSDVHGCYSTLMALIDQLPNKEKSHLIFVGDLIDRGQDSAKVVEFVKNGGYSCIKGNHEQMMIDSFQPSEGMYSTALSRSIALWNLNGGEATDKSYNEPFTHLLGSHLEWLKQLPNYLEYDIKDENDKMLFVTHGFGLPYWKDRHNLDIAKKSRDARILDFNIQIENSDIYNVFGHDVQENGKVLITDNYAAIDTGCVFGGFLTALEWPSKRIIEQKNIENK